LPEHCVAPGVQDPETHAPLLQTPAHAAPLFCQVPVLSQVCGCDPVHWVAPGVQLPVQVPLWQTYAHVDPVFPHVPVLLHVWGCSGLEVLHC
jgi:hypothetical protein